MFASESSSLRFIERFVLRHRWWFVVLMSVSFIAIEIEDMFPNGFYLNYHALGEIIIFGLIFPVAGGYIVSALLKIETDHVVTKRLFGLQHNLIEQMNHAQDWDELTAEIVHFFNRVAPFAGLTLFIYDRFQLAFKPAIEWRDPQYTIPAVGTSLAQHHVGPFTQLYKLHPHTVANLLPGESNYFVYGLPFVQGHTPMALIYLYLPTTEHLNAQQIVMLNNVGPVIASAIAVFHPDGYGLLRGAAAEAEKRRLARHLHDTLAQNLSYLCLQLDILRSTNQLEDVPRTELRQKLTALYAAANESYEQIRMTMTTLQPTGATDLETGLCKRVNKLAERVNLAVTTTSDGPLVPLAPHMKHQIDAIFREALANIEKHAHATRIHLDFNWKSTELIITLQDNGQGFDFGKVGTNHYGLTIMQERAKEIGATFTLNSSPQQGTTILLRTPLAQPLLAARR